MDYSIHFTSKCRFKSSTVVGEKILSPSATFDPRSKRIVKPKVSICQKKEPYHTHWSILLSCSFLRHTPGCR